MKIIRFSFSKLPIMTIYCIIMHTWWELEPQFARWNGVSFRISILQAGPAKTKLMDTAKRSEKIFRFILNRSSFTSFNKSQVVSFQLVTSSQVSLFRMVDARWGQQPFISKIEYSLSATQLTQKAHEDLRFRHRNPIYNRPGLPDMLITTHPS